MSNSLHFRLVAGTLAGVLALLIAGGFIAYAKIKERLYQEFETSLVRHAHALADFIEYDPDGLEIDWLENDADPPGHEEGVDFIHVADANEEALATTDDFEPSNETSGTYDAPQITTVMLPGGAEGRMASFSYVPKYDPDDDEDEDEPVEAEDTEEKAEESEAPQEPISLTVARVDTVATPLASIRSLFLWLAGGIALAAAGIVSITVRRALLPFDRLRNEIGALDDTVDGHRIDLPDPPAELAPIKSELNRLLERVEQAIKRERRLTSNLAHELRTPVSGILSSLEVTLARPRENDVYRESAEECFEIAKRMHWLVTNLLSLSRIEAGNIQLQSDIVPLKESLTEWWIPFESAAAKKNITIDWVIDDDARLETDPDFLRVVMTNLFENATCYAPANTSVRIEATREGIWVENEALDLSDEAIEHVFDPFWRKSSSDGGTSAHAGLGLNLCKRIAELLGGTISASLKEPSTFQVQLRFG